MAGSSAADGVNKVVMNCTWLPTPFRYHSAEEIRLTKGLAGIIFFSHASFLFSGLGSFKTELWSYAAAPKLLGLHFSSMGYPLLKCCKQHRGYKGHLPQSSPCTSTVAMREKVLKGSK